MGGDVDTSDNVGIAFGAVIAAGASTAIGAAVVFFPKLVKLASRRVLAASLGFAAGVMTYVSFVEIFTKSTGAFTQHAIDALNLGDDVDPTPDQQEKADARGYIFGTLSFFGGVVIMIVLDKIVNLLSNGESHGHPHDDDDLNMLNPEAHKHDSNGPNIPHCIGCSDDPVTELDTWQKNAENEIEADRVRLENETAVESGNSNSNKKEEPKDGSACDLESFDDDAEKTKPKVQIETSSFNALEDATEKKKLQNMGLQTAIAIALHNFPEGLATYVAVLSEPKVGMILAIAIAIHNIPEGLCVALPVYYATGNRWKAFWWGALSGITEPIGAFFGWLVFANSFNEMVYGLMFGLVGGMMVMISFRELLPTANRFDPKDTVVSYSAVVGMLVMAVSLIFSFL